MEPTRHDRAPRSFAMRMRIGLAAALLGVLPLIAIAQGEPADESSRVALAPAEPAHDLIYRLVPRSVFLQYGGAEHVDTVVLGAIWKLPWEHEFSTGRFATSLEAGIGEWETHGEVHHSHPFSQFGFTPTLRFYPDIGSGRWFGEAGIGANVIAPAYHTDGKRFSTEFNFGDHLGIGREFGAQRQYEVVLRVEHFSNAGIDHPNPGQNFLQLRWVARY